MMRQAVQDRRGQHLATEGLAQSMKLLLKVRMRRDFS